MTTGLRLKHVAKVNAGQSPPSPDVVPFDGEGMPFLQGNAEFGGQCPTAVHRCDSAPRIAGAGALLVSVRAPVGAVNTADQRYGIGRGLAAVSPRAIHARYAYWLLLSSAGRLNSIATGSTFTAISGGDLGDVSVPLPDEREQRAVADYLDRETAQIDAFIAKNEEFITLLAERRAAFMDEALVRAGAGVPPAPLKRAVDFVTVGIVVTPAKWYVESGVPALRGLNVKPGSISTNDIVYLSDEGHKENRKSELRAGDVLVVRTGQAGAAAVVPANLDGANAIDLLIVRPGTKVVPEFLTHFLNSDSTSRLIAHGSVGSIQGHFNVGSLRDLPFPLLPTGEQWALVRMLDEQAEKIDRAIVTARRGVALARERRAAMISAAVTGKIDLGVAV